MSAALAEARALHEAGDLAAAEKVYRAVADKDPAFAEALIGLATIELQRARPNEALRLAETARERLPTAGAHATVGAALLALGRGEDAAGAYEASLAADPEQAEAYFGLGSALRALGRNEEALACFDRALAIDPDYPEAMVGRAATLAALGRHAEARAGFAEALDFDPEFVEARCGLAASLAELDEADEAEREFGLALAAHPDHTPALIDLAMLLRNANRPREALPLLRRALALQPEDAELLLALGETLEECGEFVDAQELFERMAKDAPRSARALYVALRDRRAEAGDPLVQSLLALADDLPRLTRGERIFVHFALGKALAELGEPERAFAHLIEGNTLRRQEIEYDEGLVLGAFDRIRSSFAGSLAPARPILGAPPVKPIFIVGMPRSGSTLVEQVLASHPLVQGGGERTDFIAAMRAVGLDSAPGANFPDTVVGSTPLEIRALGIDYLRRVSADAGEGGFVTDKSTVNFTAVGLIYMAIPGARFIHCLRDPIDTCLSCFSKLFTADVPFAFDLAEIGRYYAAYERVMAHWRDVLPLGAMLDVRYEDLVADLEGQARRMLDYCSLPWDPAVLDFHRSPRPVRTASLRQVRQPIYRTSVGRWRPDDSLLRPLAEALSQTS
jgi:tetratricopeptide (TPR) repeat protein